MMELLVIRHAEALPIGSGYPTDEARPLSAAGERAADEVGRRLADTGTTPDRVFASPLVRARSTAERIARQSGAPEPTLEPRLAPGGETMSLVVELSSMRGRIAIVGHEPSMSALVGQVLGGGAVRFLPASVAHLQIADGATEAVLLALLPPPFTKGR